MKKLLFSILILTFSLSACNEESKKEDELTSFILVEQALEKNDWTVAAHLSQRILIEELDMNKRWQALQSLVESTKSLGDVRWTITALEGNLIDFTSPKAQEYILSELIIAHASALNYTAATEYAEKLLKNQNLSDARIAELEITIANYALILSDFTKAENSLKSCLLKDELAESYRQCTFMLGNLYYLSNKNEESMQQIDIFLNLPDISYPNRAQALFLKGDMLETAGKKKEALELYKQSIRYHPNPETIQVRIKNLETKQR